MIYLSLWNKNKVAFVQKHKFPWIHLPANVIMHFNVLVCYLRNRHSPLCLPVPISYGNVKSEVFSACPKQTHTPDWKRVCLLLAACWHSQVSQRATFNSLWTDAFVSGALSWSSNLCANDKAILHLCICICKYRYIDGMRGYQMNFWPFLIFDTRVNPPRWVWIISLQAQPVAYFLVSVFKWVYVRCWYHILVFWGFWLLCLKYYINAPVPISYIFFDDIFR